MRPVDLRPISADEQTSGRSTSSSSSSARTSSRRRCRWAPACRRPCRSAVALTVIAVGAVGGAALVAALAPIGTRLRVPSIVAVARRAGLVGRADAGAAAVRHQLRVDCAEQRDRGLDLRCRLTGIGTPACGRSRLGLARHARSCSAARAPAALVDRVAVPLLLLSGAIFTIACLRARRGRRGQAVPLPPRPTSFAASTSWPAIRCRGC